MDNRAFWPKAIRQQQQSCLHTYRKLVYTDCIGNATRTARKKCWTI